MADVSKDVDSTVKDGSTFSNAAQAEQAYKNMQTDVTNFQSQHGPGTQEYKDYVSGVAAGLQKNGTLPALSVFWAEDTLKKGGQPGLTPGDLKIRAEAAATDPNQALDSAFAQGLQSRYDQLKGANIDTDASGVEKDMITPADLSQARRFSQEETKLLSCQGQVTSLTGERDTANQQRDAANQEKDTANQQRDAANTERDTARTEKDQLLAQRNKEDAERRSEQEQAVKADLSKKAQLPVGNGEGYWHLASRILSSDGQHHKNIEIAALTKQLQELNHNRALLKGDMVPVMSADAIETAAANAMASYDAREAKRRSQ